MPVDIPRTSGMVQTGLRLLRWIPEHCIGCKSLVEVPVEFHGGMFVDDPDIVPSFLNRCPDCNSTNVQPWDSGHSCPMCGEYMTTEAQG